MSELPTAAEIAEIVRRPRITAERAARLIQSYADAVAACAARETSEELYALIFGATIIKEPADV